MPETTARCRVAIVGAGYTAREHARALGDVAGVQLAGIHSRTRSRAEKLAAEFEIAVVCDSVDELYERSRADLVVVTVTELSMNSICGQCFRHPWTVLVEKPPGYNLEDAEAIRAAASSLKRSVFVAMNRRCLSATTQVLGQVNQVPGARFIKILDQQSQARALAGGQPKVVVDNWMFANSIHVIDYMRVFGRGAVTSIQAVLPWEATHPEVVVSLVRFGSGDVALYEGIWHGPGPWAASVTVPGRRWEMRPLEQAVTQQLGAAPESLPTHEWDSQFKPGFRLQAQRAVAAALHESDDQDLPPLATLDDALETMRLVARIFQSR